MTATTSKLGADMLTDEQRQAVENAVYGRTLTQANVFALADLLSVRQPAAIDKQEAAVTRDDVEQARDRILEQSKNSLFRSGVKICAGEILSPIEPCDKPPAGWTCSRTKGHEGPCAASLAAPSVEQDERGAKACPFCGGSAEVHERNTDDGKPFYVQCDGCYIEVAYAGTREASLAIWNARTASTSANGDRFDPYRLKVAEECCERLMSACTDAGCPDGVRMDDWIRENIRSTSANVAQGAEAIYQAKIIVDPKWTDVTKSEFDNYVELGGFDTRVVYAAPPAQTALTDDARDAERYRFLRAGFGDMGPEVDMHNAFVDGGEVMDRTIDAALTAAQSASEGNHAG